MKAWQKVLLPPFPSENTHLYRLNCFPCQYSSTKILCKSFLGVGYSSPQEPRNHLWFPHQSRALQESDKWPIWSNNVRASQCFWNSEPHLSVQKLFILFDYYSYLIATPVFKSCLIICVWLLFFFFFLRRKNSRGKSNVVNSWVVFSIKFPCRRTDRQFQIGTRGVAGILRPRVFLPPCPLEVRFWVEVLSDSGVAPVPVQLMLFLPTGQCSPAVRLCLYPKDIGMGLFISTHTQAALTGTWNCLILFFSSSWLGYSHMNIVI